MSRYEDRADLEDLLARYTLAIDTGAWDDLDSVFTPEAQIDYTASGGIAAGFAEVKDWLAVNLPAFSQRRMHTLGQIVTSFDGAWPATSARVTAYFHNPMVISDGQGGERLVEVGGFYHHTVARTPDGWRSTSLHEQVVWTRGF